MSLEPSRPATGPAAAPEDWAALAHAGQRHGMSHWVDAALPHWPAAPREARGSVGAAARAQSVRALAGVAELAHVVTSLRDGGIDVLALKGPLFARWLYGDLGTRRFADLDLLVAPGARGRAMRILHSQGYTLAGGIPDGAAAVIYAGVGAWPLVHDARVPLDLHWRAQAARFGSPLTMDDLWRESIVVKAAGCELRIPGGTHGAALMLVHAAKHLWASLELLLAIAHLARRPDVDWGRVQGMLSAAGVWSGAAAGLAVAGELFECELPAPMRALPLPASVLYLQRQARVFLSMPDVEGADRREEFRAHWGSLDSVGARVRYAASRVLAPTPLEWAWCRLPARLSLLYVPLRLVRLAVAGAAGLLATVSGERCR